jgi:hypothetical protein
MAFPFLEYFFYKGNGFGILGKTVMAVRAANQVAVLPQGAGALATAGVKDKFVAAQGTAIKSWSFHHKPACPWGATPKHENIAFVLATEGQGYFRINLD